MLNKMSSSLSFLQLPNRSTCALSSLNNPQLNVRSSSRVRGVTRVSGSGKSCAPEKTFFGTRLRSYRSPGSERLHFWQSDGPGRSPKLKVVVRSAMSTIPEKPLGLYDPAFDKDSCGVGFVAELSGEGCRKTVRMFGSVS